MGPTNFLETRMKQAMDVCRPIGRLAMKLSISASWVIAALAMGAAGGDRVHRQDTMVEIIAIEQPVDGEVALAEIDRQTAELLELHGVIELIEVDEQGTMYYASGSGGRVDVVVGGTGSAPGDDGSNLRWIPTRVTPGGTLEVPWQPPVVEPCVDGRKRVTYTRWVRVSAKCENGQTVYAWVIETFTCVMDCNMRHGIRPPTNFGEPQYDERQAWPRGMPQSFPNNYGGSTKRIAPHSFGGCDGIVIGKG